MTLKDARAELRTWLEDMAALKAWADAGNPEAEPFVTALAAARERALVAAKAYAEAAGDEAGK
jgi:hypothetical protein